MSNTYNIYRMASEHKTLLLKKIISVRLVEQKTIRTEKYTLKFYFSQDLHGNSIWWWKTYRDFFLDEVIEPKNKFHFALLIAEPDDDPNHIYLVSLGKSHFYLSGFIEKDFGVNLAIRIANENSILLKKSRYFSGAKRQEISTYEKFIPNSYQPGESVDHLKVKALDSEVWGEKSIIFADSIQMDTASTPLQLHAILDEITNTLSSKELIKLPKLEPVLDETLNGQLDSILTKRLIDGKVLIEEFEIVGIEFCFRFLDCEYQIYYNGENRTKTQSLDLGNSIEIQAVTDFIKALPGSVDLNKIKIQFKSNAGVKFTKPIKEILDFYVRNAEVTYFLKSGVWYTFNQVFTDYLARSIEGIGIEMKEDLIEDDYLKWRTAKELSIQNETASDKILYREYYFNEKQAKENGFELMDRECESIRSLVKGRRNYRLEVADLYKNEEIVAVKISKDEKEMIYNIEQSKDSITMIMNKTIECGRKISGAALWFVFEDKVSSISDINSIQFLLAIESWRQLLISHQVTPKIYISRHVK